MHHTRPSGARQDCRHSREPFHALFASIAERTDISPAAKLLYAALVSVHRKTRAHAPTQTDIGAMIGLSRHQVWRAQCELIAAGLLVVRRQGQGLPNAYALQDVDQHDLDGSGHQEPRPYPSIRHSWSAARKNPEKRIDRDTSHGSGYDVAAYLAHERATYAREGQKYRIHR